LFYGLATPWHHLTGDERDRALEQLEIVATIPAGPSYGDLLFNPCWDDLRGDPRFDKIVAAAKLPADSSPGLRSSCPKPLYLHTPLGKKLTFVYPYTHFGNLVGSERKNSPFPTGTLVR
jgi:hypothetical protein